MHNSTLAQPDAGAATMLSEWQVIGAAIQSPNTVLPLLDGAGVSEKTFEDVRCRKAWRTLQAMREARAPIELVSVAEKYADGGDSFDAKTNTRTITKISKVYEVSLVNFPAYPTASAEARSTRAESLKKLEARNKAITLCNLILMKEV